MDIIYSVVMELDDGDMVCQKDFENEDDAKKYAKELQIQNPNNEIWVTDEWWNE